MKTHTFEEFQKLAVLAEKTKKDLIGKEKYIREQAQKLQNDIDVFT